mmetsp:Transcript_51798/g.110118  ORF Transcript_51798/g.110118 Transcript_51798/m.110118 type:complete len:446 (-) Transcript_51798:301-1638(-)
MNETTILLSPSPGDPNAKPDFLATVEPLLPRRTPFTLPFELVLDGYTRETWSSGKGTEAAQNDDGDQSNDDEWKSCYLVSTDGRNRLPGFLKYLQGRKKAAVGKFEAMDDLPSSTPGGGGKAILVVPYDPPPIPAEDLPQGVDSSQVMFVKYLRDENIVSKRSPEDVKRQQQQRLQQQKMQQQKQQQMMQQKKAQEMKQRLEMVQQKKSQSQRRAPAAPAPSSGKRGGLLGNLLGAQRRTENHLHVVRSKKASSDPMNFDPTAGAAGCINAFRTKVSEDLEKFKSDPATFVTKVSMNLASLVKSVPLEEMDKVTMDVFKFTVHEAVEEVGMDRWIAVKEPSEFMDECTMAIYKEGHCPPEILEELNKGEMPDEAKGQAKHLAEAQTKAMQKKGKKRDEEMVKKSLKEDNVRVLNANKRDRRTLEQIQRDMQQGEAGEDAKRGRYD